jgi:hypothetical protein
LQNLVGDDLHSALYGAIRGFEFGAIGVRTDYQGIAPLALSNRFGFAPEKAYWQYNTFRLAALSSGSDKLGFQEHPHHEFSILGLQQLRLSDQSARGVNLRLH